MLNITFCSNHIQRDFSSGRLVVQVTIEDDATELTRHEEFFFSVPADFHAHNDLVAAALMAVMGRGFNKAQFNFPISTRCAELLPQYHRLTEVSPVDVSMEPRRPGQFIGVSFSGGLDSLGVWVMLNDVARMPFKVITAEFDGFHRESVGYAPYHRDVSCWTNFRRVFGDRGFRFDAAIPILFADYADLYAFVSGHIFGSGPPRWSDPRSEEPPEYLPQNAISEAGGLKELHIVRCLHTPGFLRFLVATAPERVELGFHASDSPGNYKGVLKGLMLKRIYADLGIPAPSMISNLVMPQRRQLQRGTGLWTVWAWKELDRATALRVVPQIAGLDWSPLEDSCLDFFWRYCPITANQIPEELRATLLAGLRAAGVDPYTERDYEDLERVRQFVISVNTPEKYAPD